MAGQARILPARLLGALLLGSLLGCHAIIDEDRHVGPGTDGGLPDAFRPDFGPRDAAVDAFRPDMPLATCTTNEECGSLLFFRCGESGMCERCAFDTRAPASIAYAPEGLEPSATIDSALAFDGTGADPLLGMLYLVDYPAGRRTTVFASLEVARETVALTENLGLQSDQRTATAFALGRAGGGHVVVLAGNAETGPFAEVGPTEAGTRTALSVASAPTAATVATSAARESRYAILEGETLRAFDHNGTFLFDAALPAEWANVRLHGADQGAVLVEATDPGGVVGRLGLWSAAAGGPVVELALAPTGSPSIVRWPAAGPNRWLAAVPVDQRVRFVALECTASGCNTTTDELGELDLGRLLTAVSVAELDGHLLVATTQLEEVWLHVLDRDLEPLPSPSGRIVWAELTRRALRATVDVSFAPDIQRARVAIGGIEEDSGDLAPWAELFELDLCGLE